MSRHHRPDSWLASPAVSYITGQTIIIDGGLLAGGRTGPDVMVHQGRRGNAASEASNNE